jgi:AICAR transformylase/IMP cyclohydrolase PurH
MAEMGAMVGIGKGNRSRRDSTRLGNSRVYRSYSESLVHSIAPYKGDDQLLLQGM